MNRDPAPVRVAVLLGVVACASGFPPRAQRALWLLAVVAGLAAALHGRRGLLFQLPSLALLLRALMPAEWTLCSDAMFAGWLWGTLLAFFSMLVLALRQLDSDPPTVPPAVWLGLMHLTLGISVFRFLA